MHSKKKSLTIPVRKQTAVGLRTSGADQRVLQDMDWQRWGDIENEHMHWLCRDNDRKV